MDTDATTPTAPTMTLSELAAFLSVSNQALYDLRSQGRGPRGFRVGRQLRFRASEIEAWLAAMEANALVSTDAKRPWDLGKDHQGDRCIERHATWQCQDARLSGLTRRGGI